MNGVYMPKLLIEPTATASWQTLIQQAANDSKITIDSDLESYLVFLLMRFLKENQLGHLMMGMEYLNAQTQIGHHQQEQLRDVADHCLLLSGLYPQIADKRNVNISYFVNLGRTAYLDLSNSLKHAGSLLYKAVSQSFVLLMDILLTIRSYTSTPVVKPLQAFNLWTDTGSFVAQKSIHPV